MSGPFIAACVQPTSGPDIEENFRQISGLIREARAAGASFIATPEVSNLIAGGREQALAKSEDPDDSYSLKGYCDLARELKAWLLIGSLSLRRPGETRLANRSFLIGDDGVVRASYDKIHMFDVDLGNGESHEESASYRPGEQLRLARTPWAKIGMTVCYDVRFPYLYRALAMAGAEVLTIPSAFTWTTGNAHWHVLMRARAIENGCFVIAPAQCGRHPPKRRTFGHSLIVDPWGAVLADGGENNGFITAEIDPAAVTKARRRIPALKNDRQRFIEGAKPSLAAE